MLNLSNYCSVQFGLAKKGFKVRIKTCKDETKSIQCVYAVSYMKLCTTRVFCTVHAYFNLSVESGCRCVEELIIS